MELREVIRRRRMVRAFQPGRPVRTEQVTQLLEAAIRAPSAGFTQGWDFLVLEDAGDRDRFWQATADLSREPNTWLRGMMTAPLLVVCLSNKQAYLDRYAEPDKGWTDRSESRWPVPYWHVDTGMAALLMLLTAVDDGLAACFFGVGQMPEIERFRQAFDVPDDRFPVGVVAVGHSTPDRRSPSLRRGRRPVSAAAHRGRFGVPYEPREDDER
ncbi:MAG: nitroreductase family protein [Actinomycetes bacterium]